jgi:two-component system, NarL family, sensor histidine kinase UhpB
VLHLHIADRGKGFDVAEDHRGLGLVSMRERVLFLNGTIAIRSAPGRGTRIAVHVPVAGQLVTTDALAAERSADVVAIDRSGS